MLQGVLLAPEIPELPINGREDLANTTPAPAAESLRELSAAPLVLPQHVGIAIENPAALPTFATKHAELLDRYDPRHNVESLYVITKESIDGFAQAEGEAFSKFKYGDPDSIAHFAKKIAAQIWEQHGEKMREDPSQFCVLAPAYRKNPTAAVLLSQAVGETLRNDYGVDVLQAGVSRRVLAAGDYGTLKTREAREALIYKNFYYDGPPLARRTVLFVEDALVSGTHYQETQRVLVEEAGVKLKDIHAHFIVDTRAETFGKEQFSVENVLNHLWVDHNAVGRLTEILRKPDMQATPRVLKMLLSEPWVQVRAAFATLDTQTVLALQNAVVVEELGQKKEYAENAARLKGYAEQRLARMKEELGLEAALELNEKNRGDFLSKGAIDHPRFDRKLSLAEGYSLLKFGDPEAVEYFAHRLASAIELKYGEEIARHPERWGIAAPGYAHGVGSAKVLAERVARILDLPIVEVNRQDVPSVSFGALSDARRRYEVVASGEYKIEGEPKPNLFVIDDAVVSGANIDRLTKLLRAQKHEVIPFALVNVRSSDLATEEVLNASIISAKDPGHLISILNDPRSTLVMRTLKTVLSAEPDTVRAVFSQVDLPRAIEVFNAARDNGLDRKSNFRDGFAALRETVNNRIRAVKGDGIPPYEALCILDDQNAPVLLPKIGPHYSALKYGDPEEMRRASAELVSAVKARYGEEIAKSPGEWVVAATPYYRMPNASSYLGSRVAEELGLPFLDTRHRSSFAGEFGAIEEKEQRRALIEGKAYLSNPDAVLGKRIIYIDDAIVSGIHLEEQTKILERAGAHAICPFALLDVATSGLSAEKTLNYAGVKADSAEEVLNILSSPDAPLLTRTAKLLLKLTEERFEKALSRLSDNRIFELAEGAALEGYGEEPSMSGNFARLMNEAETRHAAIVAQGRSITDRRYGVMLFDYDETLRPTLAPLSPEVMRELVFFLKQGVQIGIQTLQPLGERGLGEYTMAPLREYIDQQGEDPALLSNLHLIPSEGISAYRINKIGLVNAAPEYNVGFQPEEWERLQGIVFGGPAGALASRHFIRGGYISLHFPTRTDLESAKSALAAELEGFEPEAEVVEKKAANHGKHVLHIKAAAASKALGRDYMIHDALREAERIWSRPIRRDEVLVAGDRMGTSPGESDDAKMFVYGGVNVALGSEARTGCYHAPLGNGPEGMLKLLSAIRERWEESERLTGTRE